MKSSVLTPTQLGLSTDSIKVMHVDQMQALDWLTSNTHNRPLNKNMVRKIADDMRSGRWMDNGETIKFSKEGVLLDGQHRLMAIVEADVRIPLIVVFGIDEAAQSTIDIGAVRTIGNILSLNGIPNGNKIAAVARVVLRYQQTPNMVWSTEKDPTKIELVEFSLENADKLVYASNSALAARKATNVNSTAYGALAYLVQDCSKHIRKWDDWHEAILYGHGLDKGDARLSFRNYHQRRKGQYSNWEGQVQVALAIKAWNAYVLNKPAQILRFGQNEMPMPKVR